MGQAITVKLFCSPQKLSQPPMLAVAITSSNKSSSEYLVVTQKCNNKIVNLNILNVTVLEVRYTS